MVITTYISPENGYCIVVVLSRRDVNMNYCTAYTVDVLLIHENERDLEVRRKEKASTKLPFCEYLLMDPAAAETRFYQICHKKIRKFPIFLGSKLL